ncbi:MAG: Gfo/Idh/MocA family protein [Candidatus Humimicrobiaceae bacterium]
MMKPIGFYRVDKELFEFPEVGVGIIGYGFMGKAHVNAYKKCSYMSWPPVAIAKLVAVCGRPGREKEAMKAAYRFGFEGYYNDFRLMVKDTSINLIDNCTPDDIHFESTMAAIDSGKNVICEKPLAMTSHEAKKIYLTAKNAGVKHMLGHNYRFMPAVRFARNLIDEGILGRIYEFRGSYLQSVGGDPENPVENVWYASGTRSGVNLGIGCHVIDLSRFLIGEIKTVFAVQKTFNKSRKNINGKFEQITADESNFAIVEFDNGAIGSVESSGIASGRLNQHTFEINASKGSMHWNLEDPNHLYIWLRDIHMKEITGFTKVSVTHEQDPFSSLAWPPGHNMGWENGHVNEIYHLLDCIVNDKKIEPYGATFYDGYVIQLIMEAMQDSSYYGKKIEIKPEI